MQQNDVLILNHWHNMLVLKTSDYQRDVIIFYAEIWESVPTPTHTWCIVAQLGGIDTYMATPAVVLMTFFTLETGFNTPLCNEEWMAIFLMTG